MLRVFIGHEEHACPGGVEPGPRGNEADMGPAHFTV